MDSLSQFCYFYKYPIGDGNTNIRIILGNNLFHINTYYLCKYEY